MNLRKIDFNFNWIFLCLFLFGNQIRALQFLIGILSFLPFLFVLIFSLMWKKDFRLSWFIAKKYRYETNLLNFLKIVIIFPIILVQDRVYILLKKFVLKEKSSVDWRRLIMTYLLGSPLWYIKLISEIALKISKVLKSSYTNKENVFKIKLWRTKKEIISTMNKRLNEVLEESKKKRIYIEKGRLKFNSGLMRIYDISADIMCELSIANKNKYGKVLLHPLLSSNNLHSSGIPITHKPLDGQKSVIFKRTNDPIFNHAVYNSYQKDNIRERQIESFDVKEKEKQLILLKALNERYNTYDCGIHVNAYHKENIEVINKNYSSISEEDLIKMGFSKKSAEAIIKERNKFKLDQYQLDFIEEFEMRKASFKDEKGRIIYDVEKLTKYDHSNELNYYKRVVKINKCMEVYNLWEAPDEEIRRLEIEFSKDEDYFEI